MTRSVHFVLVLAALLAAVATAHAQEVVDQSNDPASTRSFSCGTPPIANAAIAQSFVPGQPALSAVELRLRAGSAFPAAGLTTTVRIRAAAPDGAILATATADIAGPQTAGTQMLVRFGFDGIELMAGETYFIEWLTPNGNVLTWVGAGGDPYAPGDAYSCVGRVLPPGDVDYNFTTFAPAPSLSPKQRLEALADRVPYRCLRRLVVKACRCLERGHTRFAVFKLIVFKHKVRILTRFGWLDPTTGRELITEAREIVHAILA